MGSASIAARPALLACFASVLAACESGPAPAPPAARYRERAYLVAAGSGARDGYEFEELDRFLHRSSRLARSVAVVLRQGGEEIYRAGLLGADATTVIPTASSSKWLSAATVLSLCDEGRIDLDAPIATYLPQLSFRKGRVTVRQLLSHTSGYAPHLRMRGLWRRGSGPRIGPVARIAPLVASPGSRFCYGSISFQIAGQIAERVTGRHWDDIFQQRIAEPCGMKSTRFRRDHPRLAAGGFSTAEDYSLFVEMIRRRGVSVGGRRVLSERAIEQMHSNHTFGLELECVPQLFERKQSYGLGLWRGAEDSGSGDPLFVSHFGTSGFKGFIDYTRDLTGVFAIHYARGRRPLAKRRFRHVVEIVQRIVPAGGAAGSAGPEVEDLRAVENSGRERKVGFVQ
ncbi:MAG: serine hydrolase domain-containing protein [Polyangia bacterium]